MDRAQRLMIIAATVSLLAHAVPIFGIRFVMPSPKKTGAPEPLEIVLVNQKTRAAPNKAEVLAQANLDGGGNTDGQHRAKSPLPGSGEAAMPEIEQTLQQQKQLEDRATQLMTRLKSDYHVPDHEQAGKNQDGGQGADQQEMRKQAAQLAGQAAQISKDWNEYQSKPRKTFVGARAKQTSVAFWVDAWAQKVEKVGTLAYPADRHGNKLYGTLRVTVEVGVDGNILSHSVDTSSGNLDLDRAALKILERAAPFPRLPGDMLDETGRRATVLVITRRWIFGKNTGTFGID